MTSWSIILAVVSACLALTGLSLTAAGFVNARREARRPPSYEDVTNIRDVMGSFVLGAKLWQPFLGLGLTACSVLFGLAAGVVGALG